MSADLLEAAEGLHELVEAHADKAEQKRRLPSRLVHAMRDAHLFRMCVPHEYGGPEADPMTFGAVIEKVAQADGAAGWCTMIGSTTSSMSLFLEPEWARRLFGDAKTVSAGVFAPNGRAVRDGDGWRVTGRWQWGAVRATASTSRVARSPTPASSTSCSSTPPTSRSTTPGTRTG
ncbi:MAG: acyl-CoA dehydrogenase family protein [Ilumatobacteraceae bacterium]